MTRTQPIPFRIVLALLLSIIAIAFAWWYTNNVVDVASQETESASAVTLMTPAAASESIDETAPDVSSIVFVTITVQVTVIPTTDPDIKAVDPTVPPPAPLITPTPVVLNTPTLTLTNEPESAGPLAELSEVTATLEVATLEATATPTAEATATTESAEIEPTDVPATSDAQTAQKELPHTQFRAIPAAAPFNFAPTLGDFDNDGDLDLAFLRRLVPEADMSKYSFEIYQNDGSDFTLWQTHPLTPELGQACQCFEMTLVDVDVDGFLDVTITMLDTVLLLKNHQGQIVGDPIWQTTLETPSRVVWGDFDKDGDDDLAFSQAGRLVLHENVGGSLSVEPIWQSTDAVDEPSDDALFFSASQNREPTQWADVNNDGWLDLIATAPGSVYLNQSGSEGQARTLTTESVWTWTAPTDDEDAIFGPVSQVDVDLMAEDFDGDGWLDFALYTQQSSGGPMAMLLGRQSANVHIFHNEGSVPSTVPAYKIDLGFGIGSREQLHSADIDSDGDFDLIMDSGLSILYNDNGTIDPDRHFITAGDSVAIGDIDNNGRIDLVSGDVPTIFYNEYINFTRTLLTDVTLNSCMVQLRDVNSDQQLDLTILTEDFGMFVYEPQAAAQFSQTVSHWNMGSWVDLDNDSDLDFATTTLYYNEEGTFVVEDWLAIDNGSAIPVDIDQDGWQDLLVYGAGLALYKNNNGVMSTTPEWEQSDQHVYYNAGSISFDDIDSDGDLDLSLIREGLLFDDRLLVYENTGRRLRETPILTWKGLNLESFSWGDVDGDGALEIIILDSDVARLYDVEDGEFLDTFNWEVPIEGWDHAFRWLDVDNDEDVDLVEWLRWSGDAGRVNLYLNTAGNLPLEPNWSGDAGDLERSYDIGDINQDGVLDIFATHCEYDEFPFIYYGQRPSVPSTQGSVGLQIRPIEDADVAIQSGIVPLSYTLTHPDGQPFRSVQAFYSANGGGDWQPAVAAAGTVTTNLTLTDTQGTYTFYWDVDASRFYGSSQNVVVRIEALPSFKSSQRLGGVTTQIGSVGAQTDPLFVRGLQIHVTENDEEGNVVPAIGAFVYLDSAESADSTATLVTDQLGRPLETDLNGLLEGRQTLEEGDQVVAMRPITVTRAYTVYHTSAMPTVAGLQMDAVTESGIQELHISAENTLTLFNFDISLEWDARSDLEYLSQLQSDIRRTSEVLFDLTNGQAALGHVRIFHAKERWQTADIVILANNQHRPNANLGGIVTQPMSDTLRSGDVIPDAFTPGQIRMGANWNRYGEPSGTIGEDWPRVLAHEIGHYAFFLLDNYFGRDPQTGGLRLVDCKGSVMTDSYRQDYSEFLSRQRNNNGYAWDDSCEATLAQQTTQRSDWETIRAFYPFMQEQLETLDGPRTLPLDVTHTRVMPYAGEREPLADEFFYLLDPFGDALPVAEANAYLIQTQGTLTQTDDTIVPLGSPIGQLVQARGVLDKDKVCAYTDQYTGCTSVQVDDRRLTLRDNGGWRPNIDIRPTTNDTLLISVTVNVETAAESLSVQIYPYAAPVTETVRAPILQLEAQGGGVYSAEFEPPFPIFTGHARVWSNLNQAHESVVRFAWMPGWDGYNFTGWGGYNFTGWGGNLNNSWQAPIASADGQVTILDLDDIFSNRSAVLVQSVENANLPSWLIPIGDMYRYLDDNTITNTTAIQFRYLERNLPLIDESQLAIYFQPEGETAWQRLDTAVNPTLNVAFAEMPDGGLYALVATIRVPAFRAGENLFSYPLLDSRSINDALASIKEVFDGVVEIDPSTGQPVEGEPPTEFVFGRLYRITVTQPTTLYLAPSK